MRTAFPVIAVLILISVPARAEVPADLQPLLDAIRMVESSGNDNPPDGDDRDAIGPFQIHRDYFIDSGVPGSYQQCRNRKFAERVVLGYWRRYESKALESRDFRTLSLCHHYGCGWRKRAKDPHHYWAKVQRYMEK